LLEATKSHGEPAGLWFCGVCGVCGVSFGPVTGLKTSLFDKNINSFLGLATGLNKPRKPRKPRKSRNIVGAASTPSVRPHWHSGNDGRCETVIKSISDQSFRQLISDQSNSRKVWANRVTGAAAPRARTPYGSILIK